jgi:hypothetical protein
MALTKRTKRSLYVIGILVAAGSSLSAIPLSSSPRSNIHVNAPFTSARGDYGPLLKGTSMPTNVIAAVAIPQESTLLGRINYDGNQGTFDRSIEISSSLTPSGAYQFFSDVLQKNGWSILEHTFAAGHGQIIARIAGSDGNYWEVGIKFPFVLTASQAGLATTLRSPSPGRFSIEVRLLQLEPAS